MFSDSFKREDAPIDIPQRVMDQMVTLWQAEGGDVGEVPDEIINHFIWLWQEAYFASHEHLRQEYHGGSAGHQREIDGLQRKVEAFTDQLKRLDSYARDRNQIISGLERENARLTKSVDSLERAKKRENLRNNQLLGQIQDAHTKVLHELGETETWKCYRCGSTHLGP